MESMGGDLRGKFQGKVMTGYTTLLDTCNIGNPRVNQILRGVRQVYSGYFTVAGYLKTPSIVQNNELSAFLRNSSTGRAHC